MREPRQSTYWAFGGIPHQTCFIYVSEKPSILAHEHLVTKREVLQDLSKIFDPLGFVAPVVIRAKILMQKLWQMKITWDEPLDSDMYAH